MTPEKEKKDECEGIASAVESLIDTSTLAAAIAEPEEFVEDYCIERRIEQRRPKIKHKATCKEKTATCVKRTCVYMLSYLGLTCIVVAYSILGGFLFPALEEDHELVVEQKAVDLRSSATENLEQDFKMHVTDYLQTFPESLKSINENTSSSLEEEIKKNVRDINDDIRKQLVSIIAEVFAFNQTDNRIAQKQDQNNRTNILKSKEKEIQDVLDFSGRMLVQQTINLINNKLKGAKTSFSSLLWSEETEMNSSHINSVLHRFQLDTYDLVNKEGWNGVDPNSDGNGKWTYAGGLLYAVTVVTTIGYGTITPKTDAGKAFTIFYALIGIPLTVLCITNIGRGMASLCRTLYRGTFCIECRQQFFTSLRTRRLSSLVADNIELGKLDRDNVSEVEVIVHKHGEVPVFLSLLLVTWYIAFGAIMFKLWEQWTIFEGAYFCFITLSTIGFGDFVPGFSGTDWDSQIKQIACSLYLLIGLATLAMCFDLLQQRVKDIANTFASYIGLVRKGDKSRNEVRISV